MLVPLALAAITLAVFAGPGAPDAAWRIAPVVTRGFTFANVIQSPWAALGTVLVLFAVGRRLGWHAFPSAAAAFMAVTANIGDAGALGLAFALVGCAVLARHRPLIFAACAGWIVAVGAGAFVFHRLTGPIALALLIPPAWCVVGTGMQWAFESRPLPRPVAAVLVAWLPIVGLIAHLPGARDARGSAEFERRYLRALKDIAPPGAAIVAGIDAPGWPRLPRDPAAVRGALASGTPVIVLGDARASLEELGVLSAPIAGVGVPMTIEEYLRAVPRGWIVAVATGDRFALGVPPRRGATFGAAGGQIDLFGHARTHFGLIGVSGARETRLESESAGVVRLQISAGGDLGGAVRAPASLAVASDEGGATIHYNGRPVAASRTGLALVLVSPDGELRAVVDREAEADADARISMNPPELSAALVTGTEPCADVTGGAWSDLSALARLSSIGGEWEGGAQVLIYVRSAHGLDPRLRPLPPDRMADFAVTAFQPADDADRAALAKAMSADGLDDGAPWLAAPYVYRIAAGSAAAGRRQLSLELGGFAEGAVARLAPAGRGAITFCAAMRPDASVSATGALASGGIDITRRDLFLFGWGRVEGSGRDAFRWSRTPNAELLLPLTAVGPMVLQVECGPAGPAATDLRVRINDLTLPPVTLAPGTHTYRWDVPASALVVGVNRVWMDSALVRPKDIGSSADDRLLGIALRRLSLGSGVPWD